MKKSYKKRLILSIFIIFIILFSVSYYFENYIKSYSIQDNMEIYNIYPINGTEFQSENLEVGNETVFIYSTLSEETALDNKDEYIITIGKVGGKNNNRYEIYSHSPQEDEAILSEEYINIYDFPQYEIKKGSEYFGSIYAGTVPIDCKSVTIQGKQATLVEQSFNLNGNNADFYLYYCAVNENVYPDSVSVVCEKDDGSKINIETEKY